MTHLSTWEALNELRLLGIIHVHVASELNLIVERDGRPVPSAVLGVHDAALRRNIPITPTHESEGLEWLLEGLGVSLGHGDIVLCCVGVQNAVLIVEPPLLGDSATHLAGNLVANLRREASAAEIKNQLSLLLNLIKDSNHICRGLSRSNSLVDNVLHGSLLQDIR